MQSTVALADTIAARSQGVARSVTAARAVLSVRLGLTGAAPDAYRFLRSRAATDAPPALRRRARLRCVEPLLASGSAGPASSVSAPVVTFGCLAQSHRFRP